MTELDGTSEVRIVAVSLFSVINQAETLKKAIQLGAQLNLCMLGPHAGASMEKLLPDLEAQDIGATIATFRKNIVEWVRAAKPPGGVQLRFHESYLFQSYARFDAGQLQLGVWDLSFGRHTKDKRIILVDPTRGLGSDLAKRFDCIWNNAPVAFKYEGHEVSVDQLEL
jgi:hypothetical protein